MTRKIVLSQEQIEFLMNFLDIKDPMKAVEAFGELMVMEKVDPQMIQFFVKEIIRRLEEGFSK